MKLVDSEGVEVPTGAELTDFRGDTAIFIKISQPPNPFGSGGKILVREASGWEHELYPSVFNCKIVD